MNGREHDFDPDLDALRAWIEGRLDAEQRARLEARIARDPALAQRVHEMAAVWSATAAGLGLAPASTTQFDEMMRVERARSKGEPSTEHAGARPIGDTNRRWRRAAAAAVVLATATAALGWAVWSRLGSGRRPPRVVQLEAISVPAPGSHHGEDPSESPPRVPQALADWSPVENGRIRWLDSRADAAAISAVTGRPIFVYGFVESCPICAGFDAHEFRDADVLAWVDRTVPLAIDLMKVDEAELQAIMARRYPLLELQDDHGRILSTFHGTYADVDMPTEFANAVKDLSVPDWKSMRAGAADVWEARESERKGEWRDACVVYETWSRRLDLPAWSFDAQDGLRRIGAAVGRRLEAVRSQSGANAAEGMSALQIEIARFQGTRLEPELRAVLTAWRESGTFPTLSSKP